jgi:thioredoxin-dependent peroxiredoxin
MANHLIGKSAPVFSAPDSNGETYNFAVGSGGSPAVLFFYPKSGTPSYRHCALPADIDSRFITGSSGCIKEVCQLQALSEKETFKRANVQIVGVSADPVEKQEAFVKKHKLTVSCPI